MQAEHHLGKAQARVLDRDPKVTGKRNLEPAAQAIAVNDGNRGHGQVIEPVDDRVPPGEARLDIGHVGHAAKFADVGAGDEPAGLRPSAAPRLSAARAPRSRARRRAR